MQRVSDSSPVDSGTKSTCCLLITISSPDTEKFPFIAVDHGECSVDISTCTPDVVTSSLGSADLLADCAPTSCAHGLVVMGSA